MYYTRPSLPISMKYKQEGVRIRVNKAVTWGAKRNNQGRGGGGGRLAPAVLPLILASITKGLRQAASSTYRLQFLRRGGVGNV